MPRLIALIIASIVLASCSGGAIGAFRKKQEAEAERDKSKDPPKDEAQKKGPLQ
jgi:hypothetical protein